MVDKSESLLDGFCKVRVLAGVGLALLVGLGASAVLYACDDGDDDTNTDGGTGKTDGGTSKDGASKKDGSDGGPIKQKGKPVEGGNIPDVNIDTLFHHDGGGHDGATGDATTEGGTAHDGGHPPMDAGGDGGTKGCTYTVSGSDNSAGTCTVTAAVGSGGFGFNLFSNGSENAVTFTTDLPGSTLVAGETTQSAGLTSGATFNDIGLDMMMPPAGSWALCYRDDSNPCGSNPTFNDVGTFNLTITKPGPALGPGGDGGAELWSAPCGTLTATLPADPDTATAGSVTLSATFCGSSTPDAGSPDAKAKDGSASAMSKCLITAAGAVNGTAGCTVMTTYVTSENETVVSITGVKPDGGALLMDNESIALVLKNTLAETTYTAATEGTLCGTSSTACSVIGGISSSSGEWQESWSTMPSGSSPNGGTWQFQVTDIGPSTSSFGVTTYQYIHGTYQGDLSIDTGGATGSVNLTVTF